MSWIAHCINCNEEVDRVGSGTWAEAAARKHVKDNLTHKVVVGFETFMDGNNLMSNGSVVETIDADSVTRLRDFADLLRHNSGVNVGQFGLDDQNMRIWWSLQAISTETEMQARVEQVQAQISNLLDSHGFEVEKDVYIESNYAQFNIVLVKKVDA